jgi:hypothetical protein
VGTGRSSPRSQTNMKRKLRPLVKEPVALDLMRRAERGNISPP